MAALCSGEADGMALCDSRGKALGGLWSTAAGLWRCGFGLRGGGGPLRVSAALVSNADDSMDTLLPPEADRVLGSSAWSAFREEVISEFCLRWCVLCGSTSTLC